MLVLEGIEANYSSLLTAEERRHLRLLRGLSPNALKLYARLTNRVARHFRVDKLRYPEIDLSAAIRELSEEKLICFAENGCAQEILDCFTLAEIRHHIDGHLALPRLWCRPEIDRAILQWPGHAVWLELVMANCRIIEIPPEDKWRFFRFIYFGELKPNLSDFVIHDLGTIQTEAIEKVEPAFKTRKEADDCFRLATLYETFRELRKVKSAATLLAWWKAELINREELSSAAHQYFDRLLDRLGKLLEKEKLHAQAIELYMLTPASPARERLARLLLKTGEKQRARDLCLAIRENPNDAEEYYAATQLIGRIDKTAKCSQARAILSECQRIELRYLETGVELEALRYFENDGWHGEHSENWLWNGMLGLALWDIIYDDSQGFHQPLQRAPSDLYRGFYFNRKAQIEQRLHEMEEITFARRQVERIIETKHGFCNPFVGWHESLGQSINGLLESVPLNGITAIMREMTKDLKNNTRGFPDLFLRKGSAHRFVEVKSENDQLSPQQYFWQQQFRKNGLQAEVLKVLPLNDLKAA